jgi:hypothetical protein
VVRRTRHPATTPIGSIDPLCLENPRPQGGIFPLPPILNPPFHAEPKQEHLDRDRFIAQLRGAMDSKTLALFEYRRLDYSWKEIALALNYANAHSAEVQFQKGLSRALKRIRSYSRLPRENED